MTNCISVHHGSELDRCIHPTYNDEIIKALEYCRQNKGLELFSYCLMTSHLHLIGKAKLGYDLPAIIRDFKKYTSKKMIRCIKKENESRKSWMLKMFGEVARDNPKIKAYQFWQEGYYAVELRNNPVEAGIVDKPEHYVYSSARDYASYKELLKVELIK